MRANKTKEKLDKGEVALGGGINIYSPDLVELMGAAGLEWVFIDCEHGHMNETEVAHLVRAAELYNMEPIVRIPTNNPHVILRHLDLGVAGVVVPHVDTRKDAEEAVQAAKYHPLGSRGSNYGSGRNNNYGVGMSAVSDYYEASNRETMVIALIESEEGVRNVEQILAVPGIDVVQLGPADLAQAMGLPPKAVVDQALDKVIEATVRAGKISAALHSPYRATDEIASYYRQGVRMFAVNPLSIIVDGIQEWVRSLRHIAGGEAP